jgi:hypothetical protein
VHSGAEMSTLYQKLDEQNLKPVADHSREEHQEVEEALLELATTSIDQPMHDVRLKRAMLLFQYVRPPRQSYTCVISFSLL